ncbi:MAG: precorrin-2 C(20)-methyltransferase [Spirochaetes bacterium]|nr:precorrin-2 C(20)-methyltransferase [Spirochaetota bacterium]
MKGKFYGIGIGPGDPELLTLKAVNILKIVDIVAVPESKSEKGSMALDIASKYLNCNTQVVKMEFPMIKNMEKRGEQIKDNSLIIKRYVDSGKNVAFLTIGDSMLYSTYIYLLEYLKKMDVEIETVPGISSFSATASKQNLPLAIHNQSLVILPLNSGTDIKYYLDKYDNIVFLKASADNNRLADSLKERGNFDVTIASKIGTEDESVSNGIDDLYGDIGYLTTVIVKKRVR